MSHASRRCCLTCSYKLLTDRGAGADPLIVAPWACASALLVAFTHSGGLSFAAILVIYLIVSHEVNRAVLPCLVAGHAGGWGIVVSELE